MNLSVVMKLPFVFRAEFAESLHKPLSGVGPVHYMSYPLVPIKEAAGRTGLDRRPRAATAGASNGNGRCWKGKRWPQPMGALTGCNRDAPPNSAPRSQRSESGVASPVSESIPSDPPGPICPRCGQPMRQRIARKGKSTGQPFWGCTAFPECKGTRALNDSPIRSD